MYLFVFIFLLLSILGLYTQIYTLQVAKMLAKQTAIAQTMLKWHGGAVKFAKDINVTVSTQGCMLSSGGQITGIPACSQGQLAATNHDYLHSGYSGSYVWNSVAYVPAGAAGQRYVLTVAVPPSQSALTAQIEKPPIGYSVTEIWQQIRNNGKAKESYGIVEKNGGVIKFVTPDAARSPGFPVPSYDLPACGASCMPVGSVGFISPL